MKLINNVEDYMKLGIDVGGVIIKAGDRNIPNSDTFLFREDYTNSPAVDGVLEMLPRLHKEFELYIISKCGRKIELRTRDWLKAHKVDLLISEDRWNFCKRRHEKAPIAETLVLDCFIDDRLQVLSYMSSVKHKFLFQPRPEEVEEWKHILKSVTVVNSWSELTDKLLRISQSINRSL